MQECNADLGGAARTNTFWWLAAPSVHELMNLDIHENRWLVGSTCPCTPFKQIRFNEKPHGPIQTASVLSRLVSQGPDWQACVCV